MLVCRGTLEDSIPVILADSTELNEEMSLCNLEPVRLNMLAKRFECIAGRMVESKPQPTPKASLIQTL